jgi:pilus assembly protein TadC
MAEIEVGVEQYIKETIKYALFLSIAMSIIIFMFVQSFIVFLFWPIVFLVAFFFAFNRAYSSIKKLDGEISKEIVFAGRFLIIELESGIPLYNAMENISNNYKYAGLYFQSIIEKVRLGTSIDDAITETIDVCPSENLKKLLWQMLNSLKTGADTSRALNTVLTNIVREQSIAMKEFGSKLNPLAMFYMMIAIIVPSLGVTMLVVIASFVQIKISLLILVILALFIGFMQLMFLMMIKNSRPNVDM